MKKMNSNFLMLLVTVLLFSSCSKEELTESLTSTKSSLITDSKVVMTPYTNYRLKTIVDPLHKTTTELNYNSSNLVTLSALYNTANGAHTLLSSTKYEYSSRNELVTETYVVAAKPNKVVVYKYNYSGLQFSTSTLSYLDITNPANPIIEDFYSYDYTFEGKNMTKLVEKSQSGSLNYEDTYTYSVVNGETNIMESYKVPGEAAMTVLEVDYANILDPLYFLPGNPFQSRYLIKSKTYNPSISENFSQTYTTDAAGKILTITKDYPNKPSSNVTITYSYEAKQ